LEVRVAARVLDAPATTSCLPVVALLGGGG
jgi:hypothetical protein